MADPAYGFREVVSNQTISPKWRDITINTGAAQGTLQDIKRTESSGGYSYVDNDGGLSGNTRNRFLYWRINHDVLEMAEDSLDVELSGNHVCLRFQDTPILDGVGVFEHGNRVVLLVSTVSSVHRIVLPHPHWLNKQFFVGSLSSRSILPSILSELTVTHLRDPFNFHVLNLSGASGMLPHTSSCWLSEDGDAHFSLANSSGSILHVCLPRPEIHGTVTVSELRKSTIMQRVFTGIVPSMMRSGNQSNDAPLSLVFHTIDQTLMLFALCRDSKIRLWSVKDQDCVMEYDLTHYVKDCPSGNRLPQTGQRHGLKKATGCYDGDLLLVAFLHFIDHRHFIVLQLAQDEDRYDLAHVTTLYGPEHDLIDFSLTSTQLWVLWSTVESEPLLCYATIYKELDPVSCWKIATLEPPIGRDFNLIEGFVDPMEAYCEQIFYPGRFSINTISRAINIFRRPTETSFVSDFGGCTSAATLREEVTVAVETEIQNRASEYELSDDVYIQLQQECWSKFYLGCVQYHQVGAKPMGLFTDDNTGLVCIIKKNFLSVLRPCDFVEFLSSLPEIANIPTDVSLLPLLDESVSMYDMRSLFLCLNIIRSKYNYELIQCCKYDLFHLMSPEMIAQAIVDNILTTISDDEDSDCFEVIRELRDELNNLKGLAGAVNTLLNVLDVSNSSSIKDDFENASVDAYRTLMNTNFFRSHLGSSIVAESISQIAQFRFEICRDLLVFLIIVNKSRGEMGISSELSETLHSVIPQIGILTQAYYVVTWICDTVASYVSPDVVDVGTRQLAFLSLSDLSPSNSASLDSISLRLIEMFVRGEGGSSARQLLSLGDVMDRTSSRMWTNAFLPHVFAVLGFVWPINVNFLFPEYLLMKCQYMQLQEYVRLLCQWCEWNSCSRKFLCGYTHLVHGEGDKAMDWFLSAAEGGLQEEFIVSKLLQCTDTTADPSQFVVLFHMKVIRLFEQFLDAERVIYMAKKTMDLPMHDVTNLLTLHTLLFKYLLELGNSKEAYAVMISNPDYSRKRDCLRQFVVILFERRQLRELIEYPYEDLHDEVVDIMESRARTIDLTNHNYYELLYSFHVHRDNFRRSGSVMYEYGMRLGNEVSGLNGLQRQAKCYLAAMNSLRLLQPEYAWIVKPLQAEQTRENAESNVNGMSPKRTYDGEDVVPALKRQVALVELKDIRLEYELVLARLQLVKLDLDLSTATGPSFTAEETVVLLSKAGLFDMAIRICNAFRLPMTSVFEALANKCVHLMRVVAMDPTAASDAWKWLGENEIPGISISSHENNASDYAWMLLKLYLEKYEEKGQVRLYHCVAARLMNLGVLLPNWFLAAYKKRDVSDVLRLYLRFGLLEDATHLTLEYIDAVLGNGKEYFGLKTGLEVGSRPVWMPYTTIDNLMEALGTNPKDHALAVLSDTLKEKLVTYHCQVECVSKEMLKLKHKNFANSNALISSS